ncbi:MAG: MFS transporter [Pseudanabaenaceae cyanobacterium SKYGB_i_bin29]|nr:MFS transporter [Pseudanabaenaceae cyanobacterium SKYG29]MDW8422371.1 MFS transporter [Pseudanabaenaceae cyanobacterium SKYGB_i_bin29]
MTLMQSLPLTRNFNFLSIWLSQVFSQIADKIYLVFTIALISQQLFNEGTEIRPFVTGVMVAFTIPAILFGSLAGVFVDRWSKKWVLIASNLLRGTLILLLPVVMGLLGKGVKAYGVLLVITFLVSTLTQFFTPAEQSAITLVVQRDQLLTANSVYATTVMGALILGFAVGKPALELADRILGIWGKEVLVGGCYTLAGVILLSLVTGERERGHSQPHIWTDLQEGFAYVQTQPLVQGALVQLVTTYSVIAALTVLAVQIAEQMPQLRADDFGYLLSVSSVGIALAAGILARFGQILPYRRTTLYGTIGMAIALALLSLTAKDLFPALITTTLIGVFAGLCAIPMQTLIQEKTPEQLRGKVFGLQNNIINVALSLPLALAGVAESYFGLTIVLWSLALVALAGGLWSWSIMVK